jgi:hypothetical protein
MRGLNGRRGGGERESRGLDRRRRGGGEREMRGLDGRRGAKIGEEQGGDGWMGGSLLPCL